jgi:glycosyltransferase involved in cell wall biosynthesis
MTARISVVVITYNQRELVREAIESVLAQDWPDIELIVADDGSTDGTGDVIRSYAAADSRVVPVISPKNQGITNNLNAGFSAITGDYQMLMGGDDYLMPGALRALAEALDRNPECAACIGVTVAFDGESRNVLYRVDPTERFGRDRFSAADVVRTGNGLSPSWLIRTKVAPNRFETKLPIAADGMYFIEVARRGPVMAIPVETLRYRILRDSATGKGFKDDQFVALAIIEARFPELIAAAVECRAGVFRETGNAYLFRGNSTAARPYLRHSFHLRPGTLALAGLILCALPPILRDPLLERRRHRRLRASPSRKPAS